MPTSNRQAVFIVLSNPRVVAGMLVIAAGLLLLLTTHGGQDGIGYFRGELAKGDYVPLILLVLLVGGGAILAVSSAFRILGFFRNGVEVRGEITGFGMQFRGFVNLHFAYEFRSKPYKGRASIPARKADTFLVGRSVAVIVNAKRPHRYLLKESAEGVWL
jgi:hypothetical protein